MSEDVQRTCCSSALLDPGLDVPTDVLGEVVVDGALDSAFEGGAAVLHRMRLSCTFQDKSGTQIGTDFEGQCITFLFAMPVINC